MNTKNFTAIAIVSALIGLVSCSSDKPASPEEFINVPLYMAGDSIPADSQEKYLYNPRTKAYAVGRNVDSSNGTMREAGTVYRLEQAPTWNLIPQYDANPRSLAQQQQQEQYADVMTGQITRSLKEVNAVKDNMKENLLRQQQLKSQIADLERQLTKTQSSNKVMAENIKLMKNYIDRLEKEIKDIKMVNGVSK